MVNPKNSWTERARRFWNERQKRAEPEALTGYLLDESPPAIGRQRFEGEWKQARAWLTQGACLDLGCGTGVWLKSLASVFETVEGWDYAPAMAQASRRALKKAKIKNASVHCGQISQRKGRSVFDFIFVGGVLMYTPDKALGPLLKTLARLIKPGGTLLLRESCSRDELWLRQGLALRGGVLASGRQKAPLDYVAVYRSVDELKRRLTDAGFLIRATRFNRHYKFSDLSEDWLRRLDALSGKALQGNRARAENAAKWIFRLRFILLYPEYYLRRVFGWKLENIWFLCQAPSEKTFYSKES